MEKQNLLILSHFSADSLRMNSRMDFIICIPLLPSSSASDFMSIVVARGIAQGSHELLSSYNSGSSSTDVSGGSNDQWVSQVSCDLL